MTIKDLIEYGLLKLDTHNYFIFYYKGIRSYYFISKNNGDEHFKQTGIYSTGVNLGNTANLLNYKTHLENTLR